MSIINISNKPCQCRNTDNWADDILGPVEQQCILRKGEIIQQKTENKSFQVTERKRNFQLFVHLRLQERMQRCIIMNIFLYPSEILTADNRNKWKILVKKILIEKYVFSKRSFYLFFCCVQILFTTEFTYNNLLFVREKT